MAAWRSDSRLIDWGKDLKQGQLEIDQKIHVFILRPNEISVTRAIASDVSKFLFVLARCFTILL